MSIPMSAIEVLQAAEDELDRIDQESTRNLGKSSFLNVCSQLRFAAVYLARKAILIEARKLDDGLLDRLLQRLKQMKRHFRSEYDDDDGWGDEIFGRAAATLLGSSQVPELVAQRLEEAADKEWPSS